MEKRFFRFMFSVYIVVFLILIVCVCVDGGTFLTNAHHKYYYIIENVRKEYLSRTAKLIYDEYVRKPIEETKNTINDYEKALEKNKKYPGLTSKQTEEIEAEAKKMKDGLGWLIEVDNLYKQKLVFLQQEKGRYDVYSAFYNYTFEEANDRKNEVWGYLPIEFIEILLGLRSDDLNNYHSYRDIFGGKVYDYLTQGGSLEEVFDKNNIDGRFKEQDIQPFAFRNYENENMISIKDKITKSYNSEHKEIIDIIKGQQALLNKEIRKIKINLFVNNCLIYLFYCILGYYIIQAVYLLWFVNFILNGGKKEKNKRNDSKN